MSQHHTCKPNLDQNFMLFESLNAVWRQNFIDPFGAEIGIIQGNKVNAMIADALAPYFARPSATMALTGQDIWVLIIQVEVFPLPLSNTLCEMVENAITFYIS